MTTPSPSPERKALDYAEETLGVNRVYKDVLTKRDELDTVLTELADLRDKRRQLEDLRVDREMDVQADELSTHPGMSAAAFKDHIKVALHKDEPLANLRSELSKVSSEIDGSEYD